MVLMWPLEPWALGSNGQNFEVPRFPQNFRGVSFNYILELIWAYFLHKTYKNWVIHYFRCFEAFPKVSRHVDTSSPKSCQIFPIFLGFVSNVSYHP